MPHRDDSPLDARPAEATSASGDGATPPAVPRDTTPTWEMELLLSGALVFSLLQAPGWLVDSLEANLPRMSQHWGSLLLIGHIYLLAASYVLVATFVLHLVVRGYWVALIGMSSVFPGGVRWERLRYGPNYLRAARERLGTAPALIDRADNFATLVFALGVLMVFTVLLSMAAMLPIFGLTVAAVTFSGGRLTWNMAFGGALALALAPLLIANLVDRWLGRRVAADGALARALRRVFDGYGRMPMARASAMMMLTFTSNVGSRKGMFLVIGGIWIALFAATTVLIVRQDGLRLDSYEFLPTSAGERSVSPAHYLDRRGGSYRHRPVPFVQSEVVRGPYVRLFVPYQPRRHTQALRAHCPELADPSDDAAAERARRERLLACYGALLDIRLDGAPIAGLRLDFADDAASGLRGVLAMIPATTLAAGPHLLEVARIRHPDDAQPQPGSPRPAHRITFWR